MKKIQISDYKKGVVFSFFLHALLIYSLFFEQKELQVATQQKAVTVSLNSFTIPQELPKVSKPTPKKIVEKAVDKETPKKKQHKKYTKKMPRKEYVKKEPVVEKQVSHKKEFQEAKEIAQEIPEEKVVEKTQTQERVVQKEVAQTQPKQESAASLEKAFVQTNFEVIRALILQNLKYPSMAKRMHQTGIVELMLVISAQGKLINITLENSSGHKLLDKSALKAAQRLADLDLPVPKTTSRIVLPVAFALN